MLILKIIATFLGILVSAVIYAAAYAVVSTAGTRIKAIDIQTLFFQPLYWVLMVLIIGCEVWLGLKLTKS